MTPECLQFTYGWADTGTKMKQQIIVKVKEQGIRWEDTKEILLNAEGVHEANKLAGIVADLTHTDTQERIIEQWECDEAWSQADYIADRYFDASYIDPKRAEDYRQQMFAATKIANDLQDLFNARRERVLEVAL